MLNTVLGFIGRILYPIFSVIYTCIDILQGIFGAFAGIDPIIYDGTVIGSGNTGLETDSGIVYYLLTSDLVINMFFSMLALAVILLLVFLVMAFIRNVYAAQPKSWKDIVGSAIKGIGNFIIIPVAAILGVWLGNIVLQAINGATSQEGSTLSLSRQLFLCSSYNANKLRNGDMTLDENTISNIANFCSSYDIVVDTNQTDPNYYAECIDQAYGAGAPINTWGQVDTYYTLSDINYLILAAGGIFILYVLGAISFGMVKRLFKLVVLFIISPVMCSMYPIDNGNATSSWRSNFLKTTINAYGAVAGMNLFFAITPIIQSIDLSTVVNDQLGLTQLLLVIAGLYMVKDLIDMISNLIGAEDAYGSGAALMGNVRRRVGNGQKRVGKAVVGVSGAFSRAIGAAKGAGEVTEEGESKKGRAKAFFKSLGGSMVSGVVGKKDDKGNRTGGLLNTVGKKLFNTDDYQMNSGAAREEGIKAGKRDAARSKLNNIYYDESRDEYYAEEGGTIRDATGRRIPKVRKYSKEEVQELERTAGIYDSGRTSVAKSHGGRSAEDLDSDIALSKEVTTASKSYERAEREWNQALATDSIIVNGAEVKLSGADLDDFRSRRQSGQLYSGNDLSEDYIFTQRSSEFQKANGSLPPSVEENIRNEARNIVATRQATNQAVESYQATKQNYKELADALAQAMEKANKDKKTDFVEIDKSSIDNFKSAVSSALSENKQTDKDVVKTMKEQVDTVSALKDTIDKVVVKEIRNAAKKLAKDTENDKPNKSGAI